MKKNFLKIAISLLTIFFIFCLYASTVGIKTNKLNTKIFKAWLLYKTRSVRVEQLFKQKRSRRAKEIFNEIKYVRSERQYQRSLFERIFERTRMHVIRDVFSPWKMAMIDYQNQDEINEKWEAMKASL